MDLMKRYAITLFIVMLILATASCGEQKTELEKEREDISKAIEEFNAQTTEQGDWTCTFFDMAIDEDKVLINDYYDYVGSINTNDKTITIPGASSDKKGDLVFEYQIISGQLVLTTNDEKNSLGSRSTYSLDRVPPPELQMRINEYTQKINAQNSETESEDEGVTQGE